uniref:Uncharacterized protein n=1 Tax=Rhizophora mucronata TaxID=61149 RepID=A0A2P2JD91_RHIMU
MWAMTTQIRGPILFRRVAIVEHIISGAKKRRRF